MSFGPSDNIDEADWTKERNEMGRENGHGKTACKPFSKSLIVRTIAREKVKKKR